MTTGRDRYRKQAVGILFGRTQLHGCLATTTVMGSVRYEFASVNIGQDLTQAIDTLMANLNVADVTIGIAGAIPTSECYFATRPINSGGSSATPRTLLRESLRSSSAKLDQLAIDVLNWQAHRRPLAGIVAAPLERIEQIRLAAEQSGRLLQRLEPAANALISAAVESERHERRDRLVTRIFLGESSVLAVLSKGSRAIHWQSIPLPQGDEGAGIVSVFRSVEAAYQACGLDRPSESATIYGRKELEAVIDSEWLMSSLPSDSRWVKHPSMTTQDIARACADAYLSGDEDEFDFVRGHRAPVKLHRVVPYKEITVYLLAACFLGFVLHSRLKRVEGEHLALQSSAPKMMIGGENPRPERDRLNARATAVSQFMDQRIQWSPILGDITNSLPPGMRLTSVAGSSVMAQKRKRAVKRSPVSLTLNAECLLDDQGQLPSSVSTLAESLGQLECVAEAFDSVEVSDIRRTTSQATGVEGAEFSIVLTAKNRAG